MGPIPSEADVGAARRRLEELLDRHGLVMLHDAKFPSATACIAGETVRGSWWGHSKGKLIFETLTRVEADVAWAKLVIGKETLIHRRLWPALIAVAGSRQAWQWRGMSVEAQALLRRVRRGPVRTDEPDVAHGRRVGAVATDLQRRLLVRATSEHTASGHHARLLETWQAWGRRQGIGRTHLPPTADAMRALSIPVLEWTGGATPPGLLPWY